MESEMRLVLVVGPSGAGKDTLLRAARKEFASDSSRGFVRRYITRPPDANEDNYYVDAAGFEELERSAFFLSSWQAHDNRYGIPRSEVEQRTCSQLIASISRTAIEDFQDHVIHIVHVTARPDVLEERLRGRGREVSEQIHRRLRRQPVLSSSVGDVIDFDNSGALDESIRAFLSLLDDVQRI